ncbi:MAG: crotonase/enoyl-CoA hydratase family protein [Xanthobacteraceae bacterium]|nr:MAG: crotonase/enoyl-CoA hydratase family protein [Xanthobacteraceae bacterium]
MTEHVAVTDNGAVRTIRMCRADKKNALTQAMYTAMAEAIAKADADAAIRCVVIAGAPGAFTAGNDMEDFLKASDSDGHPIAKALDFLRALARGRKPVVAAVDGLAIGIGTTMLFHCDYVVASTEAKFLTPFIQLGLVPEGASSLLAPRLIGHQRAFALLVMGKPLDAAAAHGAGLVNALAPPGQADAEAAAAAAAISALPPEAVAMARGLIRPPADEVVRRIDDEAELFAIRMRSPEAKAAFTSFLARRK